MDDATSSFYKAFGHQVRFHRRRRELTQQELAEAMGMKRTSITNLEKGQQQVFLHQVCTIAKILNVTTSDLLPTSDMLRSDSVQEEILGLEKDIAEWVENVVREVS